MIQENNLEEWYLQSYFPYHVYLYRAPVIRPVITLRFVNCWFTLQMFLVPASFEFEFLQFAGSQLVTVMQ